MEFTGTNRNTVSVNSPYVMTDRKECGRSVSTSENKI